MSKVTMPEPEAFLYLNGEHRGVSLNLRGDMDLSDGTVRHALITTDQAEAYAAAKVREALHNALKFTRWFEASECAGVVRQIQDEIRLLMPKEQA